MATKETCEKINCTLEPGHEGWHKKQGKHGKVIISWLDGKWKSADGHGTYRYVDPIELGVSPLTGEDVVLQDGPIYSA